MQISKGLAILPVARTPAAEAGKGHFDLPAAALGG